MKPPLQRVLDKLAASGPGAFIECSQDELDAYAAYQARKVPTNLPFSVSAAINEREMRMRCLELAIHMIDERYERRDPIERARHAITPGPTPQQIADDLLAYVLTGEHRELFRERASPLTPHDGTR